MDVRAFLDTRTPLPPDALARWLAAVDMNQGDGVMSALTHAGLDSLDRARGSLGRVRESAFHLLAADALLTYACESALDQRDPAAALGDLLQRAAETR